MSSCDSQQDVDSLVASLLPEDCDRWCKAYDGKRKIIHDGLWGTFTLQPHEVAILDTPLLQRLRFIHQTGAVYLTYPSAVHTRFEHTLGVLIQASRMCSVVGERAPGLIDRIAVNNVRAAALLHDTGHGPFSHTSEQYFASLDDIAKLRQQVMYERSGPGEILSRLIVQSQPMQNFILSLNNTFGLDLQPDVICNIICGTMPDNQLFMSEFIHGPIDADKLDYMHRDGMFSGLRMHVDLDRLLASISIMMATRDGQQMRRIVGSVAGVSPLMQIMFNKMLLFMGIYHHHNVRSVDCMLWAMFELATKNSSLIGGIRVCGALDVLKLTDDRILIPELTDDAEIEEIVSEIRSRHLWKRALVISRRTVPPEMHERASDTTEGLYPEYINSVMGNEKQTIDTRRRISDRIWEEAGKPCKRHQVWLDVPSLPSIKEAKEMWIKAPGRDEPQTLGEFIPIAQWAELYGTHKWQSHVFCPGDAVEVIGPAAERVLKSEFGLEFLPDARRTAD